MRPRNLLLPGFEGGEDDRVPLRRDPSGLRRWRGLGHGLRVEVFSGVDDCWLILTPTTKDLAGVESAQKVLSRYATMARSLEAQSPRVKRYDLRAVRLVIQMPERRPTFVVEAVGTTAALQQLREAQDGTSDIAPLRVRNPPKPRRRRRKGKRGNN